MKKYLNWSLFYAIAGMVCGVFYREFTKWNGFTGVTALGKVHGHLLTLGVIVFLLVALFARFMDLKAQRTMKPFMILYNAGLILTAIMLMVRGVPQVLGMTLSGGMDAAISGVAGIGHIMLGAGLILLLMTLRRGAGKEE